jgi:hypothetical protein
MNIGDKKAVLHKPIDDEDSGSEEEFQSENECDTDRDCEDD